jgi:hypothetical protein
MLRPAKRPKGIEIVKFLRRLLRTIRANWPGTQILIRADSHYCCPEVIDFCRANGLDFILGIAPSTTCAAMSKHWRRAPKPASRPGRRQPSCGAACDRGFCILADRRAM